MRVTARLKLKSKEVQMGILFLIPTGIILLGLVGYPFIYSVYLSFTNKTIGRAGDFIGFKNYISLSRDPRFINALWRTFIFVFGCSFFKIIVALGLAVALNQKFRARNITTGLFFIPRIVPMIVVVLTWRWMFDDLFGVVNHCLLKLGLVNRPIPWLSSIEWAMPSAIFVDVWRAWPLYFVTFLAILETIPRELYEAADVDGAGRWSKFAHIMLPSLRYIIMFMTVYSIVLTFGNFTIIWVLTQGGPSHATEIIPILTYIAGIRDMRIGYALAMSLYTVPLLIGIILFLSRYMVSELELE